MAAITDLTFQQLLDQLPVGAIIVSAGPPVKVMIDVSVVSGQIVDALGDEGVVQFVTYLVRACSDAQTTANTAALPEEALSSFNPPATGDLEGDYLSSTYGFTSRTDISTATKVIGQVG